MKKRGKRNIKTKKKHAGADELTCPICGNRLIPVGVEGRTDNIGYDTFWYTRGDLICYSDPCSSKCPTGYASIFTKERKLIRYRDSKLIPITLLSDFAPKV